MIQFDSSDFFHWADVPNAHHQLPQLLRQLVMTTLPMPSLIDIPSGSSVVLPGWDGLLVVEEGNAWVPGGASAWELSCDKNPKRKATFDYDKRTANSKHVDVSCYVVCVRHSQEVGWQEGMGQRTTRRGHMG